MDINYISEFVILAETGNFMEAAEKLFISQSTLSRHIKTLEEDLGASVFDRTTRKVNLNAFGQLFLPYAKSISRIQYEYTSALGNALNDEHGNVRIGSIPVMSQYKITDALMQFRNENPRFTLDIIEGDSLQLTKMLRSNQCDLAFIREWDDKDNEFNKILYATDTLAAIMPKGHPLAKENVIHLEQLRNESLMMLAKDTFMYSLCVRECQKAGFEPRVVFTGHRAENIIDLVRKGMGIALLMKTPIAFMNNADLKIIDIEPRVTTSISVAYPKAGQISTGAKHFLNLIKSI
ncbi:MAG: LysR family transcriptional regulator [Clostridiales bacterium]|nr:LysR family transcriptional regulator [Clostridiales bacterium]